MSNPELTVGDKICNFVVLYRSPSQSQVEFEAFSDNFEMTFDILAQKKSVSNDSHWRL